MTEENEQLLDFEPAYHEGRKPFKKKEPWRPPFFEVGPVAAAPSLSQVRCSYCGNTFQLDPRTWVLASTYDSRPCPHCFKPNRIPTKVIEDHGPLPRPGDRLARRRP